MFLNSGICFHADSGRCFGFWQVFLNSSKCLGCVLDLGTCFILRPATVNSSNFRKKKKKEGPPTEKTET